MFPSLSETSLLFMPDLSQIVSQIGRFLSFSFYFMRAKMAYHKSYHKNILPVYYNFIATAAAVCYNDSTISAEVKLCLPFPRSTSARPDKTSTSC